MEITGSFYIANCGNYNVDTVASSATGAFELTQPYGTGNNGKTLTNYGTLVSFTASKSWTGATSSNGSHAHTLSAVEDSILTKSDTVRPPSLKVRVKTMFC